MKAIKTKKTLFSLTEIRGEVYFRTKKKKPAAIATGQPSFAQTKTIFQPLQKPCGTP